MPGPKTGLELVKAMIRGGEKAYQDFFRISGGEWFDEAPEYFLTTYVAGAAGNGENSYALLEVPVNMTRKEAGAIRRGRPAMHERKNGRFDVVLYWANGNPRAAVEVKSPIWSATRQKIIPDIDRLCTTLVASKDSTFQFCAFLFYASVSKPNRKHDNPSQRLRALLGRIEARACEKVVEHGVKAVLVPGSVHSGNEVDDGAWAIAAVVVARPTGIRNFSGE